MPEQGKEQRQDIPAKVKKILRQEVGFGCPAKDCGNPYLEYHHFDPPVKVRAHNDPHGMIALCAHHHKKADGGAYTDDQLRQMKNNPANAEIVKGNLDWLRRQLLVVAGGNFYLETLNVLEIDGHEVIALHRDDEGYLSLSAKMLSLAPEGRLKISDGSWDMQGEPTDLRSPPQGKELEVTYSNGDHFYLRFRDGLQSFEEVHTRYSVDLRMLDDLITFPLTVLEVNLEIAGAGIKITPKEVSMPGLSSRGDIFVKCAGAISYKSGLKWANL